MGLGNRLVSRGPQLSRISLWNQPHLPNRASLTARLASSGAAPRSHGKPKKRAVASGTTKSVKEDVASTQEAKSTPKQEPLFQGATVIDQGPGKPPRRDQMPPGYKETSGRVTRLIIAMPILLVMSYVLFDRMVLGNEQKKLPKGPADDANES